jgi:hypothetical protein
MSLVIVDAREWQKVFDLRTGAVVSEESPEIRMVKGVLSRHHYPGDVENASNAWVSDTALDLIDKYRPQLACLCYAHQYFVSRYTPQTEAQRRDMINAVFEEVKRFVDASGYTPLIIGTGDLCAVAGELDLSRLEGLAISSHWSARYAGLHRPTPADLAYVRGLDHVERVVSRQEWIDLFPGAEHDPERIPEYLLIAREGWTFRTTGTPLRKAVMIPATSPNIPVATPLGSTGTITAIRKLIEANLSDERIALIIVEGIGVKDFPLPFQACNNHVGWFYYEPGEAQYLTVMTGGHQVFAYPTGYKYHDENDNNPDYPYSGYFKTIPEHTLGRDYRGKSIAVGNRSMLTHMVFGAKMAIECFARNLYNQGTMGVIL